MKRCPDCGREVRYGREYCQHCSAALFVKARVRYEKYNLTGTIVANTWQK